MPTNTIDQPDINALRLEMDACNKQILEAFEHRMDIASRIGDVKRSLGLRVTDPRRERQILSAIADQASPEFKSYATVLFSLLMEVSSAYQEHRMRPTSPLRERIEQALETTPKLFPQFASVACQGVDGAYSQLAAEKIFKRPNITFYRNFEGVFQAVESGTCEYGVLPIENSSAGTVNAVYDLMMEHDFHIVRTYRLKVDHNVLANEGATLDGITEIYSHQQAINQCARYLEGMPHVKVTPVTNTAEAARMVAESGRTDVAALSSRACASLYGLSVLARQVNDSDNNYTRFACITKDLQVFPGADRTSLMMVAPHEPGALYKVLARFYALDINLTKLQSRPILGQDFEFMFYFDLDASVYSPEFASLVCELEDFCDDFKYLGTYSELV
ncbi:MAG: chorismate mutase [Coriobacteriaceae bacterium]|nr:chorismate mutase [Coriobacteriaceae bacterium]MDD7112056.1 prephenate dehydratase domain-containing protein [Coriobacteriaceae bacterium]MDY5809597.1 prephenate dehydratase domain-containing protein [Coriobacteriales bacterium]